MESPDGRELWIVYHVHADPAAGGGDRRIAVDRMGVREDGSLFVSDPTSTPQPLPSGPGDWSTLRLSRNRPRAASRRDGSPPPSSTASLPSILLREVGMGRVGVKGGGVDPPGVEQGAEGAGRVYLYPSVAAQRKVASATVAPATVGR